jgi:hypothetical protein
MHETKRSHGWRIPAVAACGVAWACLLSISVFAQEGASPKGKGKGLDKGLERGSERGGLERGAPGKAGGTFEGDAFGPPMRGPKGKPGGGPPDGFAPGTPGRGGPPGEDGMPPGSFGGRGRGPGMGGPPPAGPPQWPFRDWESLEKTDPEMYQLLKAEVDLDRQTAALAAKYRQAPAAQREEMRKDLEKLVNRHFDARQSRRQLEIKRLEEGLQQLRDAIADRNKARNEIVAKRVKELVGQADDLGF